MIPDLTHIVEQARQQYPQAWKDAHTGNDGTEDFIRLVTPMLAAVDPRIGLNGKRGNANDISDDAVNVRGEGPGHNNDGTPCTVIDIIGGAGGPNPVPQWGVQTDPIASTGAWVDPGDAPLPPDQPPEEPEYPVPPRDEALDEMNALDAYYKSEEGLQRPNGLSLNGKPDFEGIAAWYLDVYQNERMLGATREEARAAYVSQIRHSHEWQQKHPGETP